MYLLIFQRLFFETLIDVFYFPVWWYSGGASHALAWCLNLFRDGNRALAPALWLRNILVPMYGQYDWQGRLISFGVRLANVVGRTAALFLWLGICLVLFFSWLVFPLAVGYGLALAGRRM